MTPSVITVLVTITTMGFNSVSFGAIVCKHNDTDALARLLYREVIRYDMDDQELPDRSLNNVGKDLERLEENFSRMVFIPYDDYTNPEVSVAKPFEACSEDDAYDIGSHGVIFEHGITLEDVNRCHRCLGWGTMHYDAHKNIYVSEEQVMQLLALTQRLRKEGRWDGTFGLVRNCCS